MRRKYDFKHEENSMKIMPYTDVKPTLIDNDKAKGIAARVVIGKNDGAHNFCMRIFEISAGGNTPKHAHDWEHEIFVHSGAGEVYCNGKWKSATAGNVVFIPGNEEHQIRNPGKDAFVFACLIPSTAPEL
jgi:quercetin dioxygenase-like cupin family protein